VSAGPKLCDIKHFKGVSLNLNLRFLQFAPLLALLRSERPRRVYG
jgi:hypothetical protein